MICLDTPDEGEIWYQIILHEMSHIFCITNELLRMLEMILAMILTAISAWVLAPILSPMGAWTRASCVWNQPLPM